MPHPGTAQRMVVRVLRMAKWYRKPGNRYDTKGGGSIAETSKVVPETGKKQPAIGDWSSKVVPETGT